MVKLFDRSYAVKFKGLIFRLFRSIRVKLILFFLVPVVFIFILGFSAYGNSSEAITETFTNATISSILKTSEYYGLVLHNVEDKALQLANDSSTKDYYTGSAKGDVLEEGKLYKSIRSNATTLSTADRFIDNITIITNYGQAITTFGSFAANLNPYEEYSVSEEAAKLNDKSKINLWTGYHKYIDEQLDIAQDKYAIALSRLFLNTYSKPIGYVITDISMSAITEPMKTLELPEGSIFAFITPDGREITMDGEAKEPIFVNEEAYQNAVAAEAASTDPALDNYIQYKGNTQLFIYSKIADTGAMVCALIPEGTITSKADSIKSITYFWTSIAAFAAIVIGIYVAYGIGKVIKKMILAMKKVSEGDLTVNVSLRRKDEFDILADNINIMIKNMKDLIVKATHVGMTVVESTKNVTENSELLLASSKNISSAISEIQQGNVQQAEDTEQCLRLTDELATQINSVHDNSLAIEKIADSTKSVVRDGINEIDQLSIVTNENIQNTKYTIRDIEELEKESKSITEIISVINDIAEQTNLLSLNASIEAARAGDAGRGFSVVADEIRNLSTKSVSAAAEIEQIIRRITAKTHDTVKTVKQAETITKSTEMKLNNVVKLFHNINVHVDDLAAKLDLIASGIDDINRSKADTLLAIENISAVAEETSAASQEVDATAQQQLEAVMKLNESAKALNNDASDLDATIQLFKTE